MSFTWGRPEHEGRWPRGIWIYSLSLLLVASACSVALAQYQYSQWDDTPKFYLSSYAKSTIADSLGLKTGEYKLATGQTRTFYHAERRNFFLRNVYGVPLTALFLWPLWIVPLVVIPGLVMTVPKDRARLLARRQGARMKGPELVSAEHFSAGANGVGIQLGTGTITSLTGKRWANLTTDKESSHIMVMGDIGVGKSALIRQLLAQIQQRGETAIVYDPHREYTSQFFNAERGDRILNPYDVRCPDWTLQHELRHDGEALTLAQSVYPDKPHGDNPFFTDAPRRIFAHLLKYHPTAQQLTFWLTHVEEIDRRVAGTPLAFMIDPSAPAQRVGVLASLNMVADTLELIQPPSGKRETWSARQWSEQRNGWLFLTSTPETRARLIPLISLYLDMLVLRLMETPSERPVWFILDELASLQKLPQLLTAVTENRKSNNPMVLGFQSKSQLESRYGQHDADVLLSQPATKIILRTSEPKAAEWASDMIGKVEIERLRESRSKGKDKQQTFGLDRQVEPLVMASEISGLPELHGYLKGGTGNQVVRLELPYLVIPAVVPPLIERPLSNTVPTMAPETEAEPEANPVPTTRGENRRFIRSTGHAV